MSYDEIYNQLRRYYSEKLDVHGATPKGVDYNSIEAQEIRFAQLVRVIDSSRAFIVTDYGCGYGALFGYLLRQDWQFDYYGVDIIEKMIHTGQEMYKEYPNCHFVTQEADLPVSDYLIAGAIFNNKLDTPNEEWRDFTLQSLSHIDSLCSHGFSFNMLTAYSDSERVQQRPDLYFGDPCFYFDYCKRNFSKNVALLHDYGLYDFTILVRKDA
jgi:SAM-dependent methyltransferase